MDGLGVLLTAEDGERAEPGAERLVDVLATGDQERIAAWMKVNKVRKADLAMKHEGTGSDALLLAATFGMVDLARKLLKSDASAMCVNGSGDTALHWAAFRGCEPGAAALVEALIAAGADVNAIGDLRNTPLHLAATAGSAVAVKLLVINGADATLTNKYGHRPCKLATRADCLDVLTRLSEEGESYRLELRARKQPAEDDKIVVEDTDTAAERERDRQAEVDRAQRRREAEDAVLAEALAEDHRRRGEELERRKRDADERLRAMEEQRRVQEEAAAAARQKAKGAKGEKKKG